MDNFNRVMNYLQQNHGHRLTHKQIRRLDKKQAREDRMVRQNILNKSRKLH